MQVSVDVPDIEGRVEILKVHGGNKKFEADVSLGGSWPHAPRVQRRLPPPPTS